MKRVLLAWELGAGTGHLHKFALACDALRRAGYRPVLAVKDVVAARRVLGSDVETLPAPFWLGRAKGLPPAACYAEVLMHVGYLETDTVSALIGSWMALIAAARVDAVIAEHAPSALLAARALGMPTLVLGTGFTVPPDTAPMPSLEAWHKLAHGRLLQAESQVLATINAVLQQLQAAPLQRLAELFYQRRPMLLTLPELDHYGERPDTRYWGAYVSQSQQLRSPQWPGGSGERVFVYLHPEYRHFDGLLKQLRDAPLRTLVVAPGMPQTLADRLGSQRLRISPHAVDLAAVARECRVIVNHAAHGTLANVFALGLPVLMIPNYVEQTVLAWRAAKQGLGLMASPDPRSHNYPSMIGQLLDTRGCFEAAAAYAERDRERHVPRDELIEHLLGEIAAIVG